MNLADTLSAVATSMKASFEVHSMVYQHRGLRGGYREDVVRDFLTDYLPSQIEATSGELFDATGQHSPECDIILLDRLHVPLLIGGNRRVIPIEGAHAVLEVKSMLDSRELQDCLTKCSRVKSLRKTAYVPQGQAFRHITHAYGREWEHFPTLFTIFAYHGIDPQALVGVLEEWGANRALESTLDSIFCLDGWLICWWDAQSDQYDLLARPGARLVVVDAGERALLFFYLLYYRWLSQAWCRPIRMTAYAQGGNLGKRIYPPIDGGPY